MGIYQAEHADEKTLESRLKFLAEKRKADTNDTENSGGGGPALLASSSSSFTEFSSPPSPFRKASEAPFFCLHL